LNAFVFTSFQKKKGLGIAKKVRSSIKKMKRMFAFSRRAARETLGIAEGEGPLCVLRETTLNVQANMIHSKNGQSQLQCAKSKPKGRCTGERISCAKYRAIVDLAAQGRQIDRIAREAGVTWRTAKAVVERESRQIAERKQELLEQSLRIARRAANRIEDNIDKLPVGQLIPAYGVAVDKIAALSSDTLTQTQQHLHWHLQSNDIARQFNELLASMQAPRHLKSLPDDCAQRSTSNPKLTDGTTEQRESTGA
jgi:hypothetical protein